MGLIFHQTVGKVFTVSTESMLEEVSINRSSRRFNFCFVLVASLLHQVRKNSFFCIPLMFLIFIISIFIVDDDLVKVTRSSSGAVDGNEFKRDVISNVGFAPLKNQPSARLVIPAQIWEPVKMKFYPPSFRKSVITLLMCSNSQTIQPFLQEDRQSINVSSKLPREVWVYILSFMPRKCKSH